MFITIFTALVISSSMIVSGIALLYTEYANISILMFGGVLLILISAQNIIDYIDDKNQEIYTLQYINRKLEDEILQNESSEDNCDEVQNDETDSNEEADDKEQSEADEVEWFKKYVTVKANDQVMSAMITPKKRKFTNYVKTNTDDESNESSESDESSQSDKVNSDKKRD